MVKEATLKVYPGFPHAMPTTNADQINADMLAIVKKASKWQSDRLVARIQLDHTIAGGRLRSDGLLYYECRQRTRLGLLFSETSFSRCE